MSAIHQVLLGAGGLGYQIGNSLRFRASNSANLSRTFGAPTDGKKFTLSWWMKRGTLTNVVSILSGFSGSSNFSLQFSTQTANGSGDFLRVANPSAGATYLYTDTAIFRDPSAWYHFVFVFDSANATANDRAILYVNGTRLSATVSVTLNATTRWNESGATGNIGFGRSGFADVRDYYDGHMAEFISVDGQALTPSSFGSTVGGVWTPSRYSGTYGAQGFYLRFNDATTTTTIGNDSSGNGNNWTPSGISVTSGVTFDQMTDTPTLNYAVWSPLDTRGGAVPTNANMNPGVGNSQGVRGTFGVTSGKWYWEHTLVTASTDYVVGIGNQNPFGTYVGSNTDSVGYFSASGEVRRNASVIFTYGTWNTSGKVVGFALDQDAGTLQIYVDGVSQGSAFSHSLTGTIFPMINFGTGYGTPVAAINFGQRPFAYTPPTNFKALNTQNLTSTAVTISGSFTGNAAADGPVVWINGNPATLTINGNAVTFGTHADKIAGGFKLRTSSASYNTAGSNTWTATAGSRFVQSRRPNNAQVNP